jgi:hypothetical protein
MYLGLMNLEIISVIKTVAECNAAHLRCVNSCQDALAIGHFLTEQKANIPYGEWVPWVQDHLQFDVRTAQRYMKLYSNRQLIETTNDTLSFLTLTDAHRAVADTGSRTPAPVAEEPPTDNGNGEDIKSHWVGMPEFHS